MPVYQFRAADGEVIDKHYPAKLVPSIGIWIRHRGKRYQRIMSTPQISEDVKNVVHKYPYVSNALPRRIPGAEHTKDGKPIVMNRAHERSLASQHGYVRD